MKHFTRHNCNIPFTKKGLICHIILGVPSQACTAPLRAALSCRSARLRSPALCGRLQVNVTPILCILHVSLRMRIPHYASERIINLGNPGEIGRKAFYSFSLFFSGAKYISLLGKSNSPDFSSGYHGNW